MEVLFTGPKFYIRYYKGTGRGGGDQELTGFHPPPPINLSPCKGRMTITFSMVWVGKGSWEQGLV